MSLIIDGHNLISVLPDIDLDDPHDEAILVEKLKSYCGRTGMRCVVVFDHGIPGGMSRSLSTGPVKVIFAAAYRTNADRVIRERIRQAANPDAVTVVSSDHEVRDAALARRMRVLTSDEFAEVMARTMSRHSEQPRRDQTADVHLSPAEIDEWLRLFGASGEGDGR